MHHHCRCARAPGTAHVKPLPLSLQPPATCSGAPTRVCSRQLLRLAPQLRTLRLLGARQRLLQHSPELLGLKLAGRNVAKVHESLRDVAAKLHASPWNCSSRRDPPTAALFTHTLLVPYMPHPVLVAFKKHREPAHLIRQLASRSRCLGLACRRLPPRRRQLGLHTGRGSTEKLGQDGGISLRLPARRKVNKRARARRRGTRWD